MLKPIASGLLQPPQASLPHAVAKVVEVYCRIANAMQLSKVSHHLKFATMPVSSSSLPVTCVLHQQSIHQRLSRRQSTISSSHTREGVHCFARVSPCKEAAWGLHDALDLCLLCCAVVWCGACRITRAGIVGNSCSVVRAQQLMSFCLLARR